MLKYVVGCLLLAGLLLAPGCGGGGAGGSREGFEVTESSPPPQQSSVKESPFDVTIQPASGSMIEPGQALYLFINRPGNIYWEFGSSGSVKSQALQEVVLEENSWRNGYPVIVPKDAEVPFEIRFFAYDPQQQKETPMKVATYQFSQKFGVLANAVGSPIIAGIIANEGNQFRLGESRPVLGRMIIQDHNLR